MYTAKNHTEGPDKWVIGGELLFEEGGELKFCDTSVKPALYQSDSAASTVAVLKTDFNLLLAKLRAAGIMAATAPTIGITQQPADAEVVAGHIDGSLSIGAAASDGRDVTYQWYSNATKAATGGTEVNGATEAELDIPTDLTATTYFYCVVSAADAVSVTSDVAAVTVNAAIQITTQPADVTVTAGAITESLFIEAELLVEGTLTYQWYSNTSDSNQDGTAVTGATDPVFDIPTDLSATTYYYCVVSAEGETSATSEAATVTVEAGD